VAGSEILDAIGELARLRRIDLRPDWADPALAIGRDDEDALDLYCEAIGWAPSSHYEDDPRAHEFPLLVFHPEHGWGVAERFDSNDQLRVRKGGRHLLWAQADHARLYDLIVPLPAGKATFKNAFYVFKTAVFRRKQTIFYAILATIVVNTIALVTSFFSMQVYDRVVPSGAFSTLFVLGLGTIVALLFDFALRVIRANMLENDAVRIDTEVSEFFFSRANEIRLDARPASVGTTAAQLRGLEQVRTMLSSGTLFAFADLPFAIIFIVVIAALGGVISIVLAIAFPIAIGLALIFARLIRDNTMKAQVSGNKKNGLLVEALDAAETVKANRGQWYLLSRWNALLDELHHSELPVKRLQALASSIFGTLQQISYVCLIAWGAVEVFENKMSMGALIACSILASRVNGPLVGQLPALLVQWSYSRSSLQMLDALLALPVDRPADLELLRPNRLSGAVNVNNMVFVYPGAKSGIAVPKLAIVAGERIGIVGGVGSGKSTLLKVLSGLYAPAQGQIMIDNLDMAQVADDVLRHNIGYLPQDYRLVNGSLRENLLLGLSDPGDEAIMAMAQKTGLSLVINAHPRGLDLQIGEGGRGLSGGQRVLTGLTRLLLAEPKLLLLDEPTANLDVETEVQVLRAIQERLGADTTLVLVTHKLQLLGLTQRTIVIAGGQIAMDGPTKEVLARLQKAAPPARATQAKAEPTSVAGAAA
jgi:ATP-binding cassette subfamily C protein LapB